MSIRNMPAAALRALRTTTWTVAVLLLIVGCGSGGGGESTYPLEGDVRPDRDVEVASGSHEIDSLTLPAGVTMTSDGPLILEVSGDVDLDGRLEANGKIELRVAGETEVDGEVVSDGGGVAPAALGTASDTPMEDLDDGFYLVAAGDVTISETAVFEVAGPLVLTDDPAQLDRTPAEANAEAETADGSDPTLVPLPPDDPAFDAQSLSVQAPALGPAQGPIIFIGGTIDMRNWPGDRPVVLFRFTGAADLALTGLTIRGPKGVTPPADDGTGEPGSDADGDDGSDGMNLNIRNGGGSITVTGTTTFELTDGGDGADAQAVCGTASGGDGGNAGNFRMTASGGIDIQGTLRIEPGDGGNGGAATATGQAGCDVEAEGGDGADVRKRLYVRGNVSGIDGIEIGDQTGGAGGAATATGGDGTDGEQCMDGQDGGDATATGGDGGESTIAAAGAVTIAGAASAGAGGTATATGGEGGRGGDCPGGDGGEGGIGGQATATGGDAGDETEGAAGGEATSNGGEGGDGGDTCGPPDGNGGDGGVGGAAEATGGRGSDDVRASTSGSGGDGGNGGDGASPGSGATGGEGTGTPDDLADGADGQDGPECDSPPPSPPASDVEVEIDFSAIPMGSISNGATYCLPVDPVGETSVDTSQVRVQVAFDYSGLGSQGGAGLETASLRSGNTIELFGLMLLTIYLGACDDPVQVLQASSLAMTVLVVQATNALVLQHLLGSTFVTVASATSEGPVEAGAEAPSGTWRVGMESSTPTAQFSTEGFTLMIQGSDE